MICPECKNIGKVYGMNVELPCPICNGTGELPADIEYDPKRGKMMKEERITSGLTLRKWGKQTGESIVKRSKQEKGYFRLCPK